MWNIFHSDGNKDGNEDDFSGENMPWVGDLTDEQVKQLAKDGYLELGNGQSIDVFPTLPLLTPEYKPNDDDSNVSPN